MKIIRIAIVFVISFTENDGPAYGKRDQMSKHRALKHFRREKTGFCCVHLFGYRGI